VQLGKRHGVSTPRLSLLLEHLLRSGDGKATEVSAPWRLQLLRQLTAAKLPAPQPRAEPSQSTGATPAANVVGASGPVTLADTLLVKKASRPSDAAAPVAVGPGPSAAALFGADPAEDDGLRRGANSQEPGVDARDLELAFKDYKQKKKGSTSGARKSR